MNGSGFFGCGATHQPKYIHYPEWLRLQSLNPDICAVYIPKSALEKAFTDEGNRPRLCRSGVTGNVEAFGVLLASCGWQVQPSPKTGVVFLQAETDVTGRDIQEA